MSSDKDDVKGNETEEQMVESPVGSDDDPSLEDMDMPVATEDDIAAAEQKIRDDLNDAQSKLNAEMAETESKLAGGGSGDGGDSPDDADAPDGPEKGDGDDAESNAEDEETGEEEEEPGQMSLLDHLGELRVRLTRAFIAIAVGMIACYGFAEQMFNILMEPMVKVFQKQMESKQLLSAEFFSDFQRVLGELLNERGFKHMDELTVFVQAMQHSLMQAAQEGHFQYTYPAEAFFSHIKISIVAGLFLVSPYVFAQIWGFIAPGLYAHERKWMIPMALVSAMFFTAGALFGYFIVFPYGFEFFAGFSTEGIQFTPKLNEYLDFCLKLLFAFGFIFELPLFIFFLARMGMVSSAGLRKKRKYAILIGFVIAAILTPPDPFTQCLMAGPLIILYEIGIWVAYFFGKKEKRHLLKQEEEAAAQAELDAAAEAAAKAAEDASAESEGKEPEKEVEKA